jgi:hypothetical protein
VITNNGDLIQLHRQTTPMIVEGDGTISQYIGEQWIQADKDGQTRVNGEIIEQPHEIVTDPKTNISTVIRPDNVRQLIMPSGQRNLSLQSEFEIAQSEQQITLQVPNFPVIQSKNGTLQFKLNEFDFVFAAGTIEQTCPDYKATFASGSTQIIIPEATLIVTPECCQVREGTQVFITHADGIEKLGTIYDPGQSKKKVETIETAFGKIIQNKEVNPEPVLLTLHRNFPPRFCAIRSDFSAVEFVRHDILPQMVEKRGTVSHPSQESVTLLTRHLPNEHPSIYIEFEVLTKPARSTLLKGLHIPKVKQSKTAKGAAQTVPTVSAADSVAGYLSHKWLNSLSK